MELWEIPDMCFCLFIPNSVIAESAPPAKAAFSIVKTTFLVRIYVFKELNFFRSDFFLLIFQDGLLDKLDDVKLETAKSRDEEVRAISKN
jgi:hypothetical protein